MNHTRSILVGLSMTLLFATLGFSADEGWSLSKLNPFSKTSSTKSSPPQAKNFNSSAKPSYRKTEPSTMDKISSGTKNMVSKTKTALTPGGGKTAKAKPAANTVQTKSKDGQKKSWVPSWLSKKEEPKKAQTIPEFLNQPRPK